MFKFNVFKQIEFNSYNYLSKSLKHYKRCNHLYYWNQILVFTNINETIGSHKSQSVVIFLHN